MSTRRRRAWQPSLEPVKSSGYDVAVSSGGGFTSNGLRIIVTGPSAADVAKATEAVVAGLADQPDLLNLQSDLVKATPEVQVTVDPNKAIAVGMSAAQVLEPGAVGARRAERDDDPVARRTDDQGHRPARSRRTWHRSTTLKALLVGTVAKVPLATDRDRRAGRRSRAASPGSTSSRRPRSPPRSRARTPAPSRNRSRPSSMRSPPAEPSRPARPPSWRASASSRARPSAACSPRWAWPSCSST